MSLRFLCSLGWSIFLSCQIVNAAENPNQLDAVTKLLVLAQNANDVSLRDGQVIVEKLKTNGGAVDVRSAYAVSLFWLAHGKYDLAQEVLNGLDEESQQSLPLQRVRLWLAVQRRDREEAEQVLNRLAKSILQPTMGESPRQLSEKSATAEFLGGMLGYWEQCGSVAMEIAPERTADKLDALRKGLRSEWSQALRAEALRVANRAKDLARLQEEFVAKTAEEKRAAILEAEQLVSTASTAVLEANIALDRTKTETQKTREDNVTSRDLLTGKHRVLALEWKQDTPGKPAVPQQPRRPRPPRKDVKVTELQPNGKYETVTRREADYSDRTYQRELREYESRMQNYQIAMAAYPGRLAAWQEADRQRRTKINEAEQEVQKDLRAVNGVISQLGKPVAAAVAEQRQRADELSLAKSRLQLWRALASEGGQNQTPCFDLRHYSLLDMEQEFHRIAVSYKK